jgi:hypothetical protein
MMTIRELESACDAPQPPDLSRYAFDIPELSLGSMFYPLGFPLELRTNSAEVLRQAHRQWSMFEHRFSTEPIQVGRVSADPGFPHHVSLAGKRGR